MRHGAIPADDAFKSWFDEKVKELMKMTGKIVRTGQQHVPVIFVYMKDGTTAMMPVPSLFENTAGKDEASRLHRAAGSAPISHGAILVVETWTLKEGADKVMKNYKHGDLSKHPDRAEAIMFNAIRGQMQLVALYMIEDNNGKRWLNRKPTMVIDPVGDPSGKFGMTGRFTIDDQGGKLNS